MTTMAPPKSGPLWRGLEGVSVPSQLEPVPKGTALGTEKAESLAAMRGYDHVREGTEEGTTPYPGPLVPPLSIREGDRGTEGTDHEGDQDLQDPDWTPRDSATLVMRLVAEFGAELESAPACVRKALTRQVADVTIPDQLTMGGMDV